MIDLSERSVAELLAKYSKPAPRYTSYPTAVDWRPGFEPQDYPEVLREAAAREGPLSLYVHVPFCKERCLFCGCNVVITRKRERIAHYVDHLERELDALRRTGIGTRPLAQMHWGGGTPTHLSIGEIERVVSAIERTFHFEPGAERSIEVDPREVTPEQIVSLADLGFRRISLGVQDTDPRVQRDIKREQPFETTRTIVEMARSSGFESLNLDLIYGLPFQTQESFQQTVEKILELRPERLALFHYAHVPWIKKHQEAMTLEAMPSPEEKLSIFLSASERLRRAGYRSIGLDHFALPEDELVLAREAGSLRRNFMGYTTLKGADLVPLGASSIGELGEYYVQNTVAEQDYVEQVEKDGLACVRGVQTTAEDRLRRRVIHDFMCNDGVDKSEISNEHAIDFDEHFDLELTELRQMAKDGMFQTTSSELRLTELGKLLVRNVAAVFDTYLRERVAKGQASTFSKTL